MSPEEEPEYQTPPTCDLLSLLLKNRRPTGAVNEVWPNLYIGDAPTAQDKSLLAKLGITHIVNAAHGPHHIDTGPRFYNDTGILYHGVEAPDCKDFDLSPFFAETADFIHGALSQKGKVLVHCARGISRSATLVLAFLMIKERLRLMQAAETVHRHRKSPKCWISESTPSPGLILGPAEEEDVASTGADETDRRAVKNEDLTLKSLHTTKDIAFVFLKILNDLRLEACTS